MDLSEKVPEACKITDSVYYIALSESARTWASQILSVKGKERKNTYQEIKNSGYDIEQNAKQLENFYIKNMKIWVKGIKYEANIDYFYSDIQSCTYNWSNI